MLVLLLELCVRLCVCHLCTGVQGATWTWEMHGRKHMWWVFVFRSVLWGSPFAWTRSGACRSHVHGASLAVCFEGCAIAAAWGNHAASPPVTSPGASGAQTSCFTPVGLSFRPVKWAWIPGDETGEGRPILRLTQNRLRIEL